MNNRLSLIAVAMLVGSAHGQTTDCSEALVRATYNKFSHENVDWRLGLYVTESDWNTIKREAGANIELFGVPVGATYSDYQNSVRQKTSDYRESLTKSKAENIMWTGLDPNAPNAYSTCIAANVARTKGLHLAVRNATKSEVSVLVIWNPTGEGAARPQWTWKGPGTETLPRTLARGEHTIVLPRPNEQQVLAVNFRGNTDDLIIEPIPRDIIRYIEKVEEYRSPEQVGWGSNWSKPYTLCTPEKPAGWTIVRVSGFHLESTTERNNCGAWTTCGGSETDTSTRACRTTSVQGHNENRFEGYGKIVSVLSVVWRYPVRE